jgi:hypothetical protein
MNGHSECISTKTLKETKLLVCELTIPTERSPLVAKLVPNFPDRGCQVVSMTDPYGRILDFLDSKCTSTERIDSSMF